MMVARSHMPALAGIGSFITCIFLGILPGGAMGPAAAGRQSHGDPFRFDTAAATLLFQVHRGRESEFERAVATLARALAQSPNPVRRRQASAWTAYELRQPTSSPSTTVSYLMLIDPVIPGASYDPLTILREGLPSSESEPVIRTWVSVVSGVTSMPVAEKLLLSPR